MTQIVLVPGPPLVAAFFSAGRECHSCRKAVDAQDDRVYRKRAVVTPCHRPDAGLEFGWAYVELQNSGNARIAISTWLPAPCARPQSEQKTQSEIRRFFISGAILLARNGCRQPLIWFFRGSHSAVFSDTHPITHQLSPTCREPAVRPRGP